MQKAVICLWFENQASEAVEFYVDLFKGKRMTETRYNDISSKVSGQPEGSIMTISFEVLGMKFLALNGGSQFKFSLATSIIINCENQNEIDMYWDALSKGGKPLPCGWVTDRFGVTWQVTPSIIDEYMEGKNENKKRKMMEKLFEMEKIDMNVLKKAYEEG